VSIFCLKQKEKILDISPLKVESIVITNQAMISTQAIVMALEHNMVGWAKRSVPIVEERIPLKQGLKPTCPLTNLAEKKGTDLLFVFLQPPRTTKFNPTSQLFGNLSGKLPTGY